MESFIESTFQILDKDSLFSIFRVLDPPSVLKLCQTSPAITQYCQNDELFKILLWEHFPGLFGSRRILEDYPSYETYKELYIHFASTKTTFYFNKTYDERKPGRISRIMPDSGSYERFKVWGIPERGTKIWAIYIYNGRYNQNLITYPDKEMALRYFYRLYRQDVEERMEDIVKDIDNIWRGEPPREVLGQEAMDLYDNFDEFVEVAGSGESLTLPSIFLPTDEEDYSGDTYMTLVEITLP